MTKRNLKTGKFMEDRLMYKLFLIACGFCIAFILTFVGVKNFFQILQSAYGTYVEVHNTKAEVVYNPLDKLEPALFKVGACESDLLKKTPKQFDKNGKVIIGVTGDVGMLQIAPQFHLKNAKAQNIDIYTAEGNIAYANYLYKRDGLAPWSASRKCWSN